MITYETPRTDSDKHCDQLKGNVSARAVKLEQNNEKFLLKMS